MKRALAKGVIQFGFGRLPGGSRLYRSLTRKVMGTQSTHIDKLARVWPGYLRVWREQCGFEIEGKRLWIHEGGYTVFPFLVGFLVTGRGPVVTNGEGELLEQYVDKSIEAALAFDVGESEPMRKRQAQLRELSLSPRKALEWVEAVGGTYHANVSSDSLPLELGSMDLAHSGGVLEHYPPAVLETFLSQLVGILRDGGISSHIFDHRDHLYHADKQIPFLNHLRFSEATYRFLFGHPLCYHNRLDSAEIRSRMAQVGLTEIGVRRLILPDSRYVDREKEAIEEGVSGLSPKILHPRFHHSEADLHTAAAHYLFRKEE
ncbi:MAG: class I SAM-dependent methyltransferase [Verrucomicrobiales bacterium]|nr:class I SAM-dependent methyltransferase [Verrucomicrobiales bacterium]